MLVDFTWLHKQKLRQKEADKREGERAGKLEQGRAKDEGKSHKTEKYNTAYLLSLEYFK